MLKASTATSTSVSRQAQQLVAAKPLAARLCFQNGFRVSAKAARASPVARAMPKVVAAATAEADAELLNLPTGYHWYETMLILKPTLSGDERDRELAKFEAYLSKEECLNINALVKNMPSKLAYPIKNEIEGVYVLYTYAAKRQTARAIQLLLSNPEAGSEDKLLRHMTLCKY